MHVGYGQILILQSKCSKYYRLPGFHGKRKISTRPSFPSYPLSGLEARHVHDRDMGSYHINT